MPNQKIDINGIDIATGKLILSDHGKTDVNSKWLYRKITWKIKADAVKSILLVGKTSVNPFETPVPATYATKIELVVNKDYPETDWEYSILWKDEHDVIHTYDPLIYIKPRLNFTEYLVPMVIVSVLSLLGIALFASNKKRKR